MLVAAFGLARIGFAAGIASFAGGDIEVDSEMAETGQSGRGEVTESLETTVGAIVDKEAVGGINPGREFSVDGAVCLKQGVCVFEVFCKRV